MFGVAIVMLAMNLISCEMVFEVNYNGNLIPKNTWKEGDAELYIQSISGLKKVIDWGTITKLEKIECITVVECDDFTGFPKWIKIAKNLKRLVFYRCKFEESPVWIGELKNLDRLFIYSCNLRDIPQTISNLKALRILNLSQNDLKWIPNFISCLGNLRYLSLSNNKIKELPDWIHKLEDKTYISLAGNSAKLTLPNWIEKDFKTINLFEVMSLLSLNYYNKFRIDPGELERTLQNISIIPSNSLCFTPPKYYIGLYLKECNVTPSNENIDAVLNIMKNCLENQRGWYGCAIELDNYFRPVISGTSPTTA